MLPVVTNRNDSMNFNSPNAANRAESSMSDIFQDRDKPNLIIEELDEKDKSL